MAARRSSFLRRATAVGRGDRAAVDCESRCADSQEIARDALSHRQAGPGCLGARVAIAHRRCARNSAPVSTSPCGFGWDYAQFLHGELAAEQRGGSTARPSCSGRIVLRRHCACASERRRDRSGNAVRPVRPERLNERPAIFVATGTGFAPFASDDCRADRSGGASSGELHLYWGGRRREDLYHADQLRKWVARHAWLSFTPVLSEPDASWTGRTGFVHRAVLEDHESLAGWDVYACGNPAMVAAARAELTAAAAFAAEPVPLRILRAVGGRMTSNGGEPLRRSSTRARSPAISTK